MQLLWGVQPVLSKEYTSTDEMIDAAMEKVKEEKLVEAGDIVVANSASKMISNSLRIHCVATK